ncbi:N-acetyltransferase [Fusibacter paucivorans]|uniref:N-acetyltransferase n=1 Tax=Fusibacter paucivorans TaxID=76009 RepID=A0ABS5PLL6_9FIRM|nr:arsinothricin resistance N-acetyltransferase ArsN1 family B [Fusibacter paucivorans]MBS7526058.1 N-acetyltransferase [Fusibacter paucivorans]
MIRTVRIEDAEAICAIYNPYVMETTVTFEAVPVSVEEMAKRIEVRLARHAWLVSVDETTGLINGYAYAGIWRERQAYRFTAEVTVYVAPNFQGNGIGKALYKALIEVMKAKGYNALVAGIALPNEKSVGVHEAVGFEKVAHFQNVGFKFDKWLDIGFWELQLNR